MSEYLNANGVKARAINAFDVIVTDAVFGNATPLLEETRKRAAALIQPLLDEGIIPVVTGFNGATFDGRPTTLGRGGSDFSASILAAVLDAAELWIWTDVDGIMSGDPRSVPNARVLDEITYPEAAELAYNGAKVLHPRTLAPLVDKKIPVWSKNSFALDKPGTKIAPATSESPRGPKAVTSMKDVALISIEPASAAIAGSRVMARALEALAAANAEVLAFSSSSYRQSFCFLVRRDEVERVTEQIESGLALEFAHGYLKPLDVNLQVGLLAVVGEGMRGTPGLAGRIFSAISRQDVNIIAIAQGSSEMTISIVVHRDGLERAIQAIHEECGLGR
jgi:aspartokinase/homoserine dehydrogenase 1